MNILEVSSEDKTCSITLSGQELSKLEDVLKSADDCHKDNTYYALYATMILVVDVCSKGKVSDRSLQRIVDCRSKLEID